jgi:ABC-type multidrug transport system permease subunit
VSPAFVVAAARKDLLRRLRDPFAFLVWLGIPIVLAGLLGLGKSGGGNPRGRLLVADLDGSFLSRGVASAFAQKPLSEFFDVETVDAKSGRERMEAGDASALLVLPAGFGKAVLKDEPARIELVKNPSQRILPAMAEETLGLLAEAVFYVQRIAGDRLRDQFRKISGRIDGGEDPWTESFAAEFGVEIRRAVERASKYLDPAVLRVDVVQAPEEKKGPSQSFGTLFFPSMIFMSLVFMAQGFSEDVWREKNDGTLRRAVASPQSVGAILAGKLSAAGVLFLVVGVPALLFGVQVFDLPWAGLPIAAVWIAASGIFVTAALVLIQLFTKSQHAGNLLTNTIVFPLTMIGGAFFPFEVMPAGMAAIGRRTPIGWALEELKAILFGRATTLEILGAFAVLCSAVGVLYVLGRARLRVFART